MYGPTIRTDADPIDQMENEGKEKHMGEERLFILVLESDLQAE